MGRLIQATHPSGSARLSREKLLARLAVLEQRTSFSPALIREINAIAPSVLEVASQSGVRLLLRFGRLLERASNREAHREFLLRAREHVNEPALDIALAAMCTRSGAASDAKRLLITVSKLSDLDPELSARASRISRNAGDVSLAIDFLERAVQCTPAYLPELLALLHVRGRNARALNLLQQRIRALEGSDLVSPAELDAIQTALLTAPRELASSKMLIRFSKLVRRVRGVSSQREFLDQAQRATADLEIQLAYITSLADCGDETEATRALCELGTSAQISPERCGKIGRLHRRFQNFTEASEFFARASEVDGAYLPELLQVLVTDGEHGEAMERARAALAAGNAKANLLFACYVALVAAGAPDAECDRVRAAALQAAKEESTEPYWGARLLRFERKYGEAIALLTAALRTSPTDQAIARERVGVMINSGEWGRYSRELLEAKPNLPEASELGQKLGLVERFLTTLGGDPESCSRARVPDAVFERVVAEHSHISTPGPAKSVLMVGASLAPGGAERIFATLARQLADSGELHEIKLRFVDLNPRRRRDFYLPLVEGSRLQLAVLNRRCRPEAPLDFLPVEHASTAQAVLESIRAERPDVLYVALEPLTVFTALAGLLARVPRIVMHSHNMPPTELHPRADFPDRLRECYRHLLTLPNVVLLTCAEAAASAYAKWLDISSPNIRHVHNGLDFSNLGASVPEHRCDARDELQVAEDQFLVGTAFSFRDEKQPLLWLDAAALIHARHPNSRFVMFGDGRLWDQAKQYAQAKGLQEVVRFPGLVSDLYRRLPAMDLFMLSSRSEALPNVLIEAQAVGVPVVSLPVGGASETFADGETGFLANGLDDTHLADAALRVLDDAQWRGAAAQRGPIFVREKFALSKMTGTILQLMRVH